MFVELEVPSVRFYSQRDERVLFDYLHALPAVDGVRVEGNAILISLREFDLDDEQVWDLLAAFRRYQLPLNELAKLDLSRFPWMRKPEAFWFNDLFGGE